MNETLKIKRFTDLTAWKAAHTVVLATYKLTKAFPKEEMFGLVSQMRRAAVSVSSNIAEGFGRRSYREKVQFYYLAQGSLIELENQILISKDIGYITEKEYQAISQELVSAHQLLIGLIRKSKTFVTSASPFTIRNS